MRQLAAIQTPVILIALLAVIACTSFLTPDEAVQVTLTEMFIRVIAVVGLYVFIGNSGIISFGHIAFMCIGAYAAGWATAEPTFKQIMLSGLPEFLKEGQYPFLAAIGGAMLLPAAVALFFGFAIMRLAGTAASIATFAFLIIVNSVYSNWDSVTAGVSLLIGIPTVDAFYLSLCFITIAMLVVGGMFSLTGAVLGVVAVTAIVEVLRVFERGIAIGDATYTLPSGGQEIGLGIVMALILIFRPNGLSGGHEVAPLGAVGPAEPKTTTESQEPDGQLVPAPAISRSMEGRS